MSEHCKIDMTVRDRHDGLLRRIEDDSGQVYEKTGNTREGLGVYAKSHDWDKAVRSIGDDLLYVMTAGGIVPMREHRERQAR